MSDSDTTPRGGRELIEQQADEIANLSNGAEIAWGLIANAYGGDWGLASLEWKQAAERWRDEFWNPYLETLNLSDRAAPTLEAALNQGEHDNG